jgi:hypothetical protein
MGSHVILTARALWAPRENPKSRSRRSHFTAGEGVVRSRHG